jgi:hypothetical protein
VREFGYSLAGGFPHSTPSLDFGQFGPHFFGAAVDFAGAGDPETLVYEMDFHLTPGSSVTQSEIVDGLPTPEPSTWAMMLVGFAGLALARYRSLRSAC